MLQLKRPFLRSCFWSGLAANFANTMAHDIQWWFINYTMAAYDLHVANLTCHLSYILVGEYLFWSILLWALQHDKKTNTNTMTEDNIKSCKTNKTSSSTNNNQKHKQQREGKQKKTTKHRITKTEQLKKTQHNMHSIIYCCLVCSADPAPPLPLVCLCFLLL